MRCTNVVRMRGHDGGGMPVAFDDIERWRTLADEAIAAARKVSEPESRRLMLFIADAYQRLAERAQARNNQKS